MRLKTAIPVILILVVAGLAGRVVMERLQNPDDTAGGRHGGSRVVPVEVAAIEQGPIALRRSFTGTIEARGEFVVAPKVSGRIEQLNVDLADTIDRGQVVAKLDNAEYVQAVTQARADLAVAQANLTEAESLLQIAERELQRIDKLQARGVSSESQRDAARADQFAKAAHVKVTKAQLTRAQAALETARIRLGYTEVTAGWRGGSEQRVVAERYVDEGQTVSANAPLLRIVELDPLTAVFFVTEKDYGLLQAGQTAVLDTDAFPDKSFQGRVLRVAPVFHESTRQARVELRVDNPGFLLKPGMFVRATIVLQQIDHATTIPVQALATRDGREGVFILTADGQSVSWQEVQTGIRQDNRVQIIGDLPGTDVVTLGQQLLDDRSPVSIAARQPGAAP